ncbi:hypothetical protein IWX90DRAFT_318589 [Phyllosticta citrichinensis]|uniref:Secreted protein n=1 Tax=Phyllosticta citrichinensis TaxID=1130410 RepID=A0ABR1XJA7_9PEZI
MLLIAAPVCLVVNRTAHRLYPESLTSHGNNPPHLHSSTHWYAEVPVTFSRGPASAQHHTTLRADQQSLTFRRATPARLYCTLFSQLAHRQTDRQAFFPMGTPHHLRSTAPQLSARLTGSTLEHVKTTESTPNRYRVRAACNGHRVRRLARVETVYLGRGGVFLTQ